MTLLPRKKSMADSGKIKRRPERSARKDRNNWTRSRLDYEALEKSKLLVGIVPYRVLGKGSKDEAKKEIRVAVMPWSQSAYVDIRVYLRGRSTGQGVLCHWEKWPLLKALIIDVDHQIDLLKKSGIIDPPEPAPTQP